MKRKTRDRLLLHVIRVMAGAESVTVRYELLRVTDSLLKDGWRKMSRKAVEKTVDDMIDAEQTARDEAVMSRTPTPGGK